MGKKILTFSILLKLFLTAALGQNTNGLQESKAAAFLEAAPCIEGKSFCCKAMVDAVNSLRGLGKDRALTVLREHLIKYGQYAAPEQHEKILLMCRLLFVNPQGWNQPRLGQAIPEPDQNMIGRFPLFPIALSKGAPFLLIRGYYTAGFTSDTPEKCVHFCEGLPLITADLSATNLNVAADFLVKTDAFQKLFTNTNDAKTMTGIIISEALCH